MSDEAVLNAEDFEVDHERQACELSLEVDFLEAKVKKLELENEVMRQYINHRRREPSPGFLDAVIGVSHDESSCYECSRLVSTFFPKVPWRGWAL